MDRWLPRDEYPDDPDHECDTCGYGFNTPLRGVNWEWDGACPECGSKKIHGGGYYG